MVDVHWPRGRARSGCLLKTCEHPVMDNGFTFRFAGRRYRIRSKEVKAGMRRQRLRIELRLSGEIKAGYEGQYVEIDECADETAVR